MKMPNEAESCHGFKNIIFMQAFQTRLSSHTLLCVSTNLCPFFGLTLQFLDDDNKCYLEINYTFDIKKEWQAI